MEYIRPQLAEDMYQTNLYFNMKLAPDRAYELKDVKRTQLQDDLFQSIVDSHITLTRRY